MKELVSEIFYTFATETAIVGMVKENQVFLNNLLFIFAIVVCFMGFKIYRGIFSLIIFGVTTLIIIYLMEDNSNWGAITTTFAVISTVFSFLAYRFNKIGAYTITLIFSFLILKSYVNLGMLSFIMLIVLILIIFQPFKTICFITSLFGVGLINDFRSEILLDFINWNIFLVAIFIVGFSIQMITNKKQKLLMGIKIESLKSYLKKGEKIGGNI